MSIYATNYIIDEQTGEPKLIKHLNKLRIDRRTLRNSTGGWNKNGKRAILKSERGGHSDRKNKNTYK